ADGRGGDLQRIYAMLTRPATDLLEGDTDGGVMRRSADGRRPGGRAVVVVLLVFIVGVLAEDVIWSGAASPGVYSWGNKQTGELADGTTTTRPLPVPSPGLANAALLAVGAVHGLAMLRDGSVVGWGHNRSGQLGNGTTTDASTPTPVSSLSAVRALAAGN